MEELINSLLKDTKIIIKGETYIVKTKTWYKIKQDDKVSYLKCELDKNKVLVIIPSDNYIYIGEVIDNMNYERINENEIVYKQVKYTKTGEGNQYIDKIEFGNEDEVEENCIFEDYESNTSIISLGILIDKGIRADVYAQILSIDDIKYDMK